ncbi:MAG TPA: MarR family transcriptional regulator [Candidatus Tetragenococcus pullicola]|nr:MarR family transcriptional regulator [Candidatus Tetragenococcus pullicola]
MTKEIILEEIWQMMKTIHDAKKWVVSPFSKELGITPLQLQAMIEIQENGELSLNQLAAKLDANSGNTSTMCKKMEINGFLVRQRREDDERFISLFLTEKGKAVLNDLDRRIEETYQPIFHNIPEDRLIQIYKGTQALKDVMLQINMQKRED